ncbi:sulfotransferase family protein [Pararhodobacter oceanensis]|uniref:Sulfotransferase domain-containing protein n=1 Tax=Pararhodobacter oceanensis TaxID=2172121 RepID=A0A2T8HTL3_9RHOB|nr:sulfotransferase [Pararhodobacter oceanensis]PVH28777.1 hypothetical protein DDE20_11420 [Pararhodobacter oceanensis]
MSRVNAADILCIGAQRSMTSWLHHAMSAHPGTWAFPNFEPVTSTSKEAHYWDWNLKRGDDWYRVLMRPLKDELQGLDFTPDYAFLNTEHIAHCKALNPEAKVIYILRDPLARALSAQRMHSMWASQNAAAEDYKITYGDAFLKKCAQARIWEHGAYSANIRRWRRQYPDLLVLNFEDLAADPLAGLKTVLQHCGLGFEALPTADQERITSRAARVIWQTPAYAIDADALHFLHGATWNERRRTEEETGLRFAEGAGLLEGLA